MVYWINDEFFDVNTALFLRRLGQMVLGHFFLGTFATTLYISTGGDCDANLVFPGNDEVCDDIDNDCNN